MDLKSYIINVYKQLISSVQQLLYTLQSKNHELQNVEQLLIFRVVHIFLKAAKLHQPIIVFILKIRFF